MGLREEGWSLPSTTEIAVAVAVAVAGICEVVVVTVITVVVAMRVAVDCVRVVVTVTVYGRRSESVLHLWEHIIQIIAWFLEAEGCCLL